MKNEVSPPVVVAIIVVVLVAIVGVIFFASNNGKEGQRPDPAAGGIRTPGGKVLPTAAPTGSTPTGNAGTATHPAAGPE